ncbi:hypothetical protein [Thermomonas fusca]|uniref:Uncharacterized protein n=1 Tax=Thermomonas fusca TaxID=215690 RepID=A0A5R9PIE6_9GAMM|nr:hypothetical protein [Thermomonas fusca]TLX22380.1 hypothetical protein E5S66_07690 [Thermomonas fusca]
MTPKTQKTVSLAVAALGVALVAMMVTTEGEPGALPLGLVLAGVAGYATAWLRGRRAGLKS